MNIRCLGSGRRCTILAGLLNFLVISSVQSISERDKNDIKNFLVSVHDIFNVTSFQSIFDIGPCSGNEINTCVHYHQHDSREDEGARDDIKVLKTEIKEKEERIKNLETDITSLKEWKRFMSEYITRNLSENIKKNSENIVVLSNDQKNNINDVKRDISNIRTSVDQNSKNIKTNLNNIQEDSKDIEKSILEVKKLDEELNTRSEEFNELKVDVTHWARMP